MSGTPKRPGACEINLNHTYLHVNEYWSVDGVTQLYATVNTSSVLSGKTGINRMKQGFWSQPRTTDCAHPLSVHSTSRMRVRRGEGIKTGDAIRRLHVRQRKRGPLWCAPYVTVHKIWSELDEKIMCIHALEHSKPARLLCGLPHFKRKHHKNILLKSCAWTDSGGLLLSNKWGNMLNQWLKIMQIWRTGFHYSNNDLFIYAAVPFKNLIKPAQNGNGSKWYLLPFTYSHLSGHVCVSVRVPLSAH